MTATDDRQRIQDLMLAYAAAVDDNDMTAYRDCFDDDVEIGVWCGKLAQQEYVFHFEDFTIKQ